MCGICGMFALEGPLNPEARRAVSSMNLAMAHRGPDGDGFFNGPRVALGHRRLAIIDRAGGLKPMSNEDGSSCITFNAETYNHTSVLPTLEAIDHQFTPANDTEISLHVDRVF